MTPDATIKLPSGSSIYLVDAGGTWFDGKRYCPPGEHAWQLVDKSGCIRARGASANREAAIKEATEADKAPTACH
jgi:hypothetical protein